jgi:hypothetical protein
MLNEEDAGCSMLDARLGRCSNPASSIQHLLQRKDMKDQLRFVYLVKAMMLVLLLMAFPAVIAAATPQKPAEGLSATEFSRIVREFSEEGGYFRSDNFTSNETSYLHVIDKLRQLGATGGAYIGVGPEQNFTYIAKVRPRIAFIVDIRRQAIIQHLMYKAVFHLSPTPAQFLSCLLSRPLPKEKVPAADTPVNELLTYFGNTLADDKAYTVNLDAIRKTIQEEFQFPLSETDRQSLEYVYKSFRTEGLDISYRMSNFSNNSFPTLGEIIAGTDLNGKPGNFLASSEDYNFIRNMHRKNLIIPVVGDFGGKKALAAVGEYLRKNSLTVTAFYTSNVEQYLFGSDSFAAFANNIKHLPITDKSLFIRAVAGRMPHPARLPGHRLATLLQRMTVFIKDFDEGRYQSYPDLVMTNYIAADKPATTSPNK